MSFKTYHQLRQLEMSIAKSKNIINEQFIGDPGTCPDTKRSCHQDIRESDERFSHPDFAAAHTTTTINITVIQNNILQSCPAEWLPQTFWSTMEPLEPYPDPEVTPMEICEAEDAEYNDYDLCEAFNRLNI